MAPSTFEPIGRIWRVWESAKMRIEIFADFSCPWCFIGRRRLGRALEMRPAFAAELTWQPFRLNPELPLQGIDRHLYMRGKFGEGSRMRAIELSLEESGGREGIRFAFDLVRRTPNTMAAHRLMRFAAGYQAADRLAGRIFTAFFEAGKDIGDIAVLTDCAAAIGLDPGAARAFLRSDAEAETVASYDELARQSGISGVPYFIFDRRYALAGAQEPASFLPLFDALTTASEGEILLSNA